MHKVFTGITVIACAVFAIAASRQETVAATYEDFKHAIRADDLRTLHKLCELPGAVRVENNLHWTPLHYAAIYGSSESVRILLAAGADLKARNQQEATPSMYGAWEAARTKLLVEKGADVNVASKDGTTPLMVAASALGSTSNVRYLLAHGADAKALDKSGGDALMLAAELSDVEVTKLLLANGADARRADGAGFTALQQAPNFAEAERVGLLLKAGADPNSFNTFSGAVKNGPIALTHETPLMLAASAGDATAVNLLLKAGAHVNELDVRKMSPLMQAIATDDANPAVVKMLIAAGADVNVKDQNGDSVLDWARKYRNPEITSALESAGAQGRPAVAAPQPPANSQAANPSDALARSLPLLAKSSPEFFKEGGGCAGCHHQPMAARVHSAGVQAGESLRQPFRDALLAERPAYLSRFPLLRALPGGVDRVETLLMTLADMQAPADDFTDAALHYLAARQDLSGAWPQLGPRPPIEGSLISRTALATRALRVYNWPARHAEFEERIGRARLWMLSAKPVTTYEEADRIMGLQAAGVPTESLRADAEKLLQKQRLDGGWAQTPYLSSDSYATGMTLHTLYSAGLLAANAPAYHKGVEFLLRTQFPDGSWYVPSRAAKFQPYFQSGFPFNHDQWISSTGTAWAAMALAHAVPKSHL